MRYWVLGMSLLIAFFALLHVVSAIAWLGGGIMFAFVVAPALAKLSPPASGEFLVKIAPRVVRFFQIIAPLTVLFGIALLYVILPTQDFGKFPNLTTYGLSITIGGSLGIVALLVTELVSAPAQLKAIGMLKEMQASGQREPTPEFLKALKWASRTATLTVLLLMLTVVFMIGAGFY